MGPPLQLLCSPHESTLLHVSHFLACPVLDTYARLGLGDSINITFVFFFSPYFGVPPATTTREYCNINKLLDVWS